MKILDLKLTVKTDGPLNVPSTMADIQHALAELFKERGDVETDLILYEDEFLDESRGR